MNASTSGSDSAVLRVGDRIRIGSRIGTVVRVDASFPHVGIRMDGDAHVYAAHRDSLRREHPAKPSQPFGATYDASPDRRTRIAD